MACLGEEIVSPGVRAFTDLVPAPEAMDIWVAVTTWESINVRLNCLLHRSMPVILSSRFTPTMTAFPHTQPAATGDRMGVNGYTKPGQRGEELIFQMQFCWELSRRMLKTLATHKIPPCWCRYLALAACLVEYRWPIHLSNIKIIFSSRSTA